MSDNVDLTECWCGYQAAGVSDLMSHQLYCDPHNTAPKVIDDQRKRIAELEAQLAAATEQRDAAIEAVMGEDYVFGQYEIEDTPTLHEIIFDQVEAEKASARAELQAENARLKESAVWDVVNALAEKDDYKQQLAAAQARLVAEEELNVRNAASASLRVAALEAEIMGMRAEITRLRAGGCAREQGTSQYCDTAQKWERRVAQCWEYVPIRVREILQSQWRRDEQEAAHIGEGER